MHMVALIAIMGEFDLLVSEMVRHGNGLDDRFRPCHYLGVMTPQTKGGDLLSGSHRQGADFFIRRHMVGIGSVAKFTGNGSVKAFFVYFGFKGMAFKTGTICAVAHRHLNGLNDGVGPIVTIKAKRIREQ